MRFSLVLVACLAGVSCVQSSDTCMFRDGCPGSSGIESANCLCAAVPLGMRSGAIPDCRITASSTHPHCPTSKARLHSVETDRSEPGWAAAWCADGGHVDANQWLQVDLGTEIKVAGVITQGRGPTSAPQHVTSYKLGFMISTDGSTWHTYTDNLGRQKVFSGNYDDQTEVRHLLDSTIAARYVRFLPQTWSGWVSMRVEILGLECLNTN
ncbi:EGF-like repeat and discoidin I-like domain-containing protein 3 [Branchiostoma floridae x Branchiostoma japonicum]